MPNQANFPDPLNGTLFQRPDRIAKKDIVLLNPDYQQILFGTTANDVVELYIYNPDGSFAGTYIIPVNDTALTLTTLVDNTGTYELLNVDMHEMANRIGVGPGRYAMVLNFFRNEVGSASTYKLYISQISDDRTELQLTPAQVTVQTLKDMYEWVTPSVPRIAANAILDQIFGGSINSGSLVDTVTPDKVQAVLETDIPGSTARITYAGAQSAYNALVNTVVSQSLQMALNLLAADSGNFYIQQGDLNGYIVGAIQQTISLLTQQNLIDPRFDVGNGSNLLPIPTASLPPGTGGGGGGGTSGNPGSGGGGGGTHPIPLGRPPFTL
jgi:hypothetical protein